MTLLLRCWITQCPEVCVDKPAVFAQVRDERTGAGAVHVAAAEGYTAIIKVGWRNVDKE